MPKISDARIAILATDGYEESELRKPLEELKSRGAVVDVVAPGREDIRSWDGDDWGDSVAVDRTLAEARVDDYDALVLPGGQINPDRLRLEADAVDLVRAFVEEGKVVAAICHGPWLLVEAGVLQGRRVTSFRSIRTDVENAGALWADEAVVTDNGLITSRKPDDLPDFIAKIVEEVEETAHEPAVETFDAAH